jgi:hypothetical protein
MLNLVALAAIFSTICAKCYTRHLISQCFFLQIFVTKNRQLVSRFILPDIKAPQTKNGSFNKRAIAIDYPCF